MLFEFLQKFTVVQTQWSPRNWADQLGCEDGGRPEEVHPRVWHPAQADAQGASVSLGKTSSLTRDQFMLAMINKAHFVSHEWAKKSVREGRILGAWTGFVIDR